MLNFIDTVGEAVAGIKDGSTIMIGGFGNAGQPFELNDALLDGGATDLTVVNNNAGQALVALAGVVVHHGQVGGAAVQLRVDQFERLAGVAEAADHHGGTVLDAGDGLAYGVNEIQHRLRLSSVGSGNGHVFEDDGEALADADADRRDAPAFTGGLQGPGQRAQDPAAGRTEGVAHRDRAAVPVHDRVVDAPGVDAGQGLRGERFVQFDRAHLLPADARLREHGVPAKDLFEVIGVSTGQSWMSDNLIDVQYDLLLKDVGLLRGELGSLPTGDLNEDVEQAILQARTALGADTPVR